MYILTNIHCSLSAERSVIIASVKVFFADMTQLVISGRIAQQTGEIPVALIMRRERHRVPAAGIQLDHGAVRKVDRPGKLVSSLSGTIAERGYHTIDFVKEDKDEVFMTKGKCYAVVVKLEESGDTSYQTYECTYNNSALTEAVSANKGESYVQYSDGEWEDFSELEWSSKEKNNANLCIKMFSDTWDSTKATPTPTMTATPTATPTAAPTATPTTAPTATPTAAPVTTPTQKAQSTPAANNPTTPVVTDNPITPDNSSARTVIVKKLKFKYSSKKVKAGKKVKLSKWLKVTKNRAGDAKITYKFTKSKYNKYATLSKKGVFKAKKTGKKKTVYVKAAAGDGSKKTANIKIKIK